MIEIRRYVSRAGSDVVGEWLAGLKDRTARAKIAAPWPGLLPATSFAMVAQTGDIYFGLWYPIVVAVMTVVIGMFMVPETYKRDIFNT